MRKRKKGMGILLAAALAFTVCACGELNGEIAESGGLQQENLLEENQGVENIPEEKRFVCSLEKYELEGFCAGETGAKIRETVRVGDRFYLFAAVPKEGGEIEACSGLQMLSIKEDGSDLKQTELAYEIAPEDAGASVSFAHYHVGANGNVYAIRNVTERGKDGLSDRKESFICCWDKGGELFWETPLTGLGTIEDPTYINALICLPDGNVALLTGGHEIGKFMVDADGNVSKLQAMGDYTEAFQNPFRMMPRDDGTMLIVYYVSGGPRLGMVEFNVAADIVGEKKTLPESITWSSVDYMVPDGQNCLLYSNRKGVFRYQAGDEAPLQVMDYFNSDMLVYGFAAFFPLESGKLLTFYQEEAQGEIQGGLLSRKAPEDIPDKELVTLAGLYIGSDVYRSVVAYNKSNATRRILIDDYSDYDSGTNLKAGYEKLNEAMLSEHMPDILVLNGTGFPTDEYIAKGLLADVDALIEKDAKLSSADFMENVFQACRVGGKLYEVIPGYQVKAYAGMPEGTTMLNGLSQEQILMEIMTFDYEDLVDKNAGTCCFNTPEFQALLELAKASTEGDGSGEALITGITIYDLTEADARLSALYGKDATFVEFPAGKSGSQGAVLQVPMSFALSARSEHMDAAWEFVSAYLAEDYQSNVQGMLPVNKKCFEDMAGQSLGTYVPDMVSLSKSVTKRTGCPNGVWEIVQNETEAYFKGKKSASDVSSIIQSQVQTYLDERK